ncbi:MAG: glycosyltransferase family 39 protein [Spirochaetales bacterium]|nr:glycosyltransferase family 39 protein [Spirochaetales bacterium]
MSTEAPAPVTDGGKKRILLIIAWAVIIAAGGFSFIANAGHEPLWYDESYSAAIINHTFADIITITGSDSHPPLYYLALKLFSYISGTSLAGLRLFSALGAFCAALLGIGPVRRIFGNKTAFLFTLLFFLFPVNLIFAQEMRMYSWACFFVTGAGLYAWLAINEGKPADWIKFSVLSLGAAYTHYFSLLAVIVINISMIVWIFLKKRKALKPYLIAAGSVFACYVPWLYFLAGQFVRLSADFWIPPVNGGLLLNILLYPFSYKFGMPFEIMSFIAICAAIFFIVNGIRKTEPEDMPKTVMAIFCLIVYTGTILAGIIGSMIVRPMLIERYTVPLMGFYLLPIAYGASRFKSKPVVLAGILIVAGMFTFQHINIYTKIFNGATNQAIAYLKEKGTDNITFVHANEHTPGILAYYFPDNRHILYMAPDLKIFSGYRAFTPTVTVTDDLESAIAGENEFWFVESPVLGLGGSNALTRLVRQGRFKVMNRLDKTFYEQFSWFNINVFKVERNQRKIDEEH